MAALPVSSRSNAERYPYSPMTDSPAKTLSIANLPGDGIGPEVVGPTIEIIREALAKMNATTRLDFVDLEAGAALYQRVGDPLPKEVMDQCERSDAILLGAMGLPSIRYADGREIAPQLDLREHFELYAGVRPVKTFPGMYTPLADPRGKSIDFVLIRESTEGLFSSRGQVEMKGDDEARDFLLVTRSVSERLFKFAFELGRSRKAEGKPGRVTCIDKANVLGSMAYFRKLFYEMHEDYKDVEADHAYVDITALNFIKQPWNFDVAVTENMYGDILSDAGAALMGGMGMAPSADIGDSQAVFQPCHGSAPDIMGKGLANPVATIQSGAMMLEWLANSKDAPDLKPAGKRIAQAVEAAFADGDLHPCEFGGEHGTAPIVDAVIAKL